MTKLDELARAVQRAINELGEGCSLETARAVARAALEAMLWPTQAMVDAVDMPSGCSTEELVSLVWRAMIEAALMEGT